MAGGPFRHGIPICLAEDSALYLALGARVISVEAWEFGSEVPKAWCSRTFGPPRTALVPLRLAINSSRSLTAAEDAQETNPYGTHGQALVGSCLSLCSALAFMQSTAIHLAFRTIACFRPTRWQPIAQGAACGSTCEVAALTWSTRRLAQAGIADSQKSESVNIR